MIDLTPWPYRLYTWWGAARCILQYGIKICLEAPHQDCKMAKLGSAIYFWEQCELLTIFLESDILQCICHGSLKCPYSNPVSFWRKYLKKIIQKEKTIPVHDDILLMSLQHKLRNSHCLLLVTNMLNERVEGTVQKWNQ